MKPLVIYPKDTNKDEITISKKEFEEIIAKVYDDGLREGIFRQYTQTPTPAINIPHTNTNPFPYHAPTYYSTHTTMENCAVTTSD